MSPSLSLTSYYFFIIKKPKFLFTNGPSPLLLLSSDDKASWSTQISWLPQMWRRTQLRHNWQICHLKICHLMSNGVIYTFEFRCPSTRHISSSSTLDHAKIHCVCVWAKEFSSRGEIRVCDDTSSMPIHSAFFKRVKNV